MEFQPSTNGSGPANNGSGHAATGEWPAVPPVPTPIKPATSGVALDPPLIRASVRAPRAEAPGGTDDSPTIALAVPPLAPPPPAAVGEPADGLLPPRTQSPLVALRRAVRLAPAAAEEVVWQSRFAQVTAIIILAVLIPVTLPLWIVLIRLTDPDSNNGAGPQVGSLVALCMLLMGAFLAGGATWMILVEMRSRARMLDVVARGGTFRESALYPQPAFEPAPFDPALLGPSVDESNQPVTAPIPVTAMPGAHATPRMASLTGQFGATPLATHVTVFLIAAALFLGAVVLSL